MKYKFLFFLMVFMHALVANPTTDRLMSRMKKHNTLLCVGLDPDLAKFPEEITSLKVTHDEKAQIFLKKVVDLTHSHVCCYKLQKAFFDLFKEGHTLLRDTIAYIKNIDSSIVVMIDCKIGDTENTMKAYRQLLFDTYKGDAVVVNPYMGDAVFDLFVNNPDLTGVVLVQTSNPSAKVVQELELKGGAFLWEKMLDITCARAKKNQNLIPVISSNTAGYDYTKIRSQIPQTMPILLAGIGAQGGDLSVLKTLLNDQRIGVFVGSSRAILYPYARDDSSWEKAIQSAAVQLKERMNAIRFD